MSSLKPKIDALLDGYTGPLPSDQARLFYHSGHVPPAAPIRDPRVFVAKLPRRLTEETGWGTWQIPVGDLLRMIGDASPASRLDFHELANTFYADHASEGFRLPEADPYEAERAKANAQLLEIVRNMDTDNIDDELSLWLRAVEFDEECRRDGHYDWKFELVLSGDARQRFGCDAMIIHIGYAMHLAAERAERIRPDYARELRDIVADYYLEADHGVSVRSSDDRTFWFSHLSLVPLEDARKMVAGVTPFPGSVSFRPFSGRSIHRDNEGLELKAYLLPLSDEDHDDDDASIVGRGVLLGASRAFEAQMVREELELDAPVKILIPAAVQDRIRQPPVVSSAEADILRQLASL